MLGGEGEDRRLAKLEEEREQQKAQLAGAEGRKAELQRELGQLHKERVRWSETEAELKKRVEQLEQERLDLALDSGAMPQSELVKRLNQRVATLRDSQGKMQSAMAEMEETMVGQLRSFEKEREEWAQQRADLLRADKHLSQAVV